MKYIKACINTRKKIESQPIFKRICRQKFNPDILIWKF